MSRQGGPRRKSSGRPTPAIPPVETIVTELGARGDGIAVHAGQKIFIPDALPGERVVVRIAGRRGDGLAGEVMAVLEPAAGRRAPPCPHFGTCGGCALQHLADEDYATWKRSLLVEALGRVDVPDTLVAPLVRIAPGSRRRASFAFRIRSGRAFFGFNARASHEVVDLTRCLLLAPAVESLMAPLRALLSEIVAEGEEGDAIATLTETGIDLLIAAEARLDLFSRERLAAFAAEQDLARLSWRLPRQAEPEPIALRRQPLVSPGGVPVVLPPGGFLQPSAEGEAALAGLVLEAAQGKRITDLFAGIGSFTFPLAAIGSVHAVEGDGPALAALKAASDATGGKLRITTEKRDLARRPLLPAELEGFDTVVFDPPRTGAAEQSAMLAASKVPLVIAVSCNPATLARDLATLKAGGYRIERVTPVDQFPWTAHLEAVAVLRR